VTATVTRNLNRGEVHSMRVTGQSSVSYKSDLDPYQCRRLYGTYDVGNAFGRHDIGGDADSQCDFMEQLDPSHGLKKRFLS
jgi:hypothetical protein